MESPRKTRVLSEDEKGGVQAKSLIFQIYMKFFDQGGLLVGKFAVYMLVMLLPEEEKEEEKETEKHKGQRDEKLAHHRARKKFPFSLDLQEFL